MILLGPGTTAGMLANPLDFTAVWSDTGSGATLNGTVWQMVVPTGFVALGFCCTFSTEGTPPKPDVRDYYCVSSALLADGVLGAQIWDDSGSGADASVGIWQPTAKAAVAFVDLHTFWATGSHEPSAIGTSVLLASSVTFG